jgi:hypothetical protein
MTTGTKAAAAPGNAMAERARRAARGGAAGGDRRVLARDPARAQEGTHIKPAAVSSVVVEGAKADPAAVSLTVPPEGDFGRLGGSDWQQFNTAMLRAVLGTFPNSDDPNFAVACVALAAFKPVDEIEGMIAAQAVALHQAAMQCLGRSVIAGQPFEVASRLRKDGANLARGMVDMLDAMDRRRGKGPQVVRVERVVVNEGGQAIVGTVAAAAGVAGRGGGG